MKSLTFPAAFLLACATYAPAQSQLVRLNVVALDKQGQPITDLKAEDLQVLDEGKPQPIVLFRANDNRHPAALALGPHEYSNRTPGNPSGATIILFDLLNGSFGDREYMVLSLVKALGSVESPGNVYLYLLTNDGTLFPIHALPEGGAEAAAPDPNWTSQIKPLLDAAIQKVYGIRPVDDRDIGIRAVTTFKVLRDLGGELSSLPGRKNIVWITNAFPLEVRYGGMCRDIKVWNVTAPCSGEYVDMKPLVRYVGGQLDAVGVSLYSVDEWNVDGGDRVLVKQTLDEFAAMTAGRSYVSGGTKNAIPDAVQATRWDYTIAFSPKNWDGKFHKLRLTSARKGIQLQSEQGYVATPPVDETAALLQAGAASKSDLEAIGLRATVTPGASPNTVRIQLRIDPSSLAIVQQNGRYSGQLASLYAGIATDGLKQLAKPSSLTLDVTAQQYESVSKDGISVSVELPVPAGVHQVRIVVVDTKANQVGSLTVPVA
jgi:VWFA-related protein